MHLEKNMKNYLFRIGNYILKNQYFSFFVYFYIIGTINICFVIFTLLFLRDNSYYYSKLLHVLIINKNTLPVLVSCFLLFIHIITRLYECLFIVRFGSYISIIHFIWGLMYYILVPWTLFFICPKIPTNWRSNY